jgi:MFS family permease
MAVAALVLGIVSIVLCTTIWGGIICGALGIIFGAVALSAIKKDPNKKGKGLAMAGLICGVIGAALSILVIIFLGTLIASWFGTSKELMKEWKDFR